jgi:endonuclease/exonuclease/phosphatase family metal-dependent hydrolase
MTVRVVTFNAGAGNPRVTTPQERFLELPFYREALTSAPGAPILALQEVGDAQARALRDAPGTARVLQRRRPGLGNALVVPARYEVVSSRARYYVRPQLHGLADGALLWCRRRVRPNWRQFGELRIWIEARLRDLETGRRFTVLNTHLSVEPSLKARQAAFVIGRAVAAAADGPVILAGDMNVPARAAKGRDVPVAERLGQLRDMVAPGTGKNIDYVLALGFEPLRSRIWAADELDGLVSDHDPREAVVAYSG